MASDKDVGYKPVADDQLKSCTNCKNFEGDEGIGKCFGHEVSAKATCNYFEPKE